MGKRSPKPRRREVIWSSELAYAVGLIATDGSLSKSGRHIDLTSKDRDQLKTFLKCIGRPEIHIGIKSGSYRPKIMRVQIGDVVLYQFLLSIGLTTNKTKSIGALYIPDEFFLDFLRGHHDGDGSFYSYYDPRWKKSFLFYLTFLSASPAHIQWIRETLTRLIHVRGHISTAKSSSVIQLKYGKKEAAQVIAQMYKNPQAPHLARKRLKIERALRIVGLTLPFGK